MLFWKVKNLNPTQGFEHVKGYAGFAAVSKRKILRTSTRTSGEHDLTRAMELSTSIFVFILICIIIYSHYHHSSLPL